MFILRRKFQERNKIIAFVLYPHSTRLCVRIILSSDVSKRAYKFQNLSQEAYQHCLEHTNRHAYIARCTKRRVTRIDGFTSAH